MLKVSSLPSFFPGIHIPILFRPLLIVNTFYISVSYKGSFSTTGNETCNIHSPINIIIKEESCPSSFTVNITAFNEVLPLESCPALPSLNVLILRFI